MILSLILVLRACLLSTAALAIVYAVCPRHRPIFLVAWFLAFFGGLLAYPLATRDFRVLEVDTWPLIVMVPASLVAWLCAAFGTNRSFIGVLRLAASVTALGSLSFWNAYGLMREGSLRNWSVSNVLNSEFLLNLSGLAAGLCLLVATAMLLQAWCRSLGSARSLALLATLTLLASLQALTHCLLNAMRLEWLEMTRERLAIVAYYDNYGFLLPYAVWLLLLAFALLNLLPAALKKNPTAKEATLPSPRSRQERLQILRLRRLTQGSGAALGLMLGSLLYFDLYASRPPRITEPQPMQFDAEGLWTIPVESVSDGRLHRFAYTAEDGRVVRFFLINRYEKTTRIACVFDACLLCGDMGYIQTEDAVICLACGVHIHQPTIGKFGGCNPIPLPEFEEADGLIRIKKTAIDHGASLFSEIARVSVTDPVSGASLVNLEAPFQYEFGGRLYYFENEKNQALFRDHPEAYVEVGEARQMRAHGIPEGH